jgi:hypothetical protein
MSIKVRIKRPLFGSPRPQASARIYNFTPAAPARPFIDTLQECAGQANLESLRNQQVVERVPQRFETILPNPEPQPAQSEFPSRVAASQPIQPKPVSQIPQPQPVQPQPVVEIPQPLPQPSTSSLNRAFSWLRKRCAQRPTKQLRVTETISLGDKRFVAVVQFDDRKFLIGGGSTGVALLTSLDMSAEQETATEPASRHRGVY